MQFCTERGSRWSCAKTSTPLWRSCRLLHRLQQRRSCTILAHWSTFIYV